MLQGDAVLDDARLPERPMTVYRLGTVDPIIDPTARLGHYNLLDCRAQITIGAHASLGFRVLLLTGGHDLHQFGLARQQAVSARPVTIGAGAWICSGAVICPGVTIGEDAVVGPGAVVMRNVPAATVVAGNPARRVKRLR